jgi:hypothetical protein
MNKYLFHLVVRPLAVAGHLRQGREVGDWPSPGERRRVHAGGSLPARLRGGRSSSARTALASLLLAAPEEHLMARGWQRWRGQFAIVFDCNCARNRQSDEICARCAARSVTDSARIDPTEDEQESH